MMHGNPGWSIAQNGYKVTSLLEQFNRRALIVNRTCWEDEESSDERIAIHCDGSWAVSEQHGGYSPVAIQDNCVIE